MDQKKIQETATPYSEAFSTRELMDILSMKTEALRQYTFSKITEHEYESLMKILEGNDRDGHELAKLLMKEFRSRSQRDREEKKYSG